MIIVHNVDDLQQSCQIEHLLKDGGASVITSSRPIRRTDAARVRQIVKRHGIPFDVSLPNATTLAAMRAAESGAGVTFASGAEDLLERLDADE